MDGRAIRTGAVYEVQGGRRAVPINDEITLLVPDDIGVVDAVADFLRAVIEVAAGDE
jgi:hypothetical protein